MQLLPTTLCLSGAAAVVNFWLATRIGQIRMAKKIFIGDAGDAQLIARMRAQANFIEQTPITLILFALVELAGKGGVWLAPLGAAFMLGRVAHGFGMDGRFKAGRPIGMATAIITQLTLVVVAVLATMGRI
ncbi:MAPEG family protein [Novosphingobium sp. FSY-8]|uniref:MAPEG family protein n=1 Tax=Novosphingobium ovatum TaxID=1908523 RepID=A0ABW9XB38_9SPHN|nr:MAPEG family protein [Novosphingobium ovatum]NBC35743.1 MAPEG family protein [Novosphingobium ovatum]